MSKVIVPVFLIILLTLIGCSGNYVQDDPGQRDDDFKIGVGSLEMSFVRNSPPAQVYELQTSTVALKMENVGATDITDGFVTITYDKAVLDFFNGKTNYFTLRGKSVDYPKGDVTVLTFPFDALPLATESQTRKTSVVVNACFDYKTEVLEQVCIDTDPYNLKPDSEQGVCKQTDLALGGTGGPVRVTKVETQFLSQDSSLIPQFIIHIAQNNFQMDRIFGPDSANSFCTSATFNTDLLNIVEYQVTLSDDELYCNRDKIQLVDGMAVLTCKGYPIDQTIGSYEAPLYILLEYGVAKSQTHRLEIIR